MARQGIIRSLSPDIEMANGRALAILFSTAFDLRCKQLKDLLILRSQKLALSESEDARFREAALQQIQT